MSERSDAGVGDATAGDASDDIEAIRERKLQELREKAEKGELGEEAGEGGQDADDRAGTPAEPVAFTGGSLAEVAGRYEVALVDFYADWCGPCRMMEEPLERLAANTDAAVIKVDADRYQGVCRQYGVQGLPTMLVFKNGEPAERLTGAQTEGALRKAVHGA
ncbi:hypothetical protein GCM10027435_27220 [Haloparvum alkalitolerans]|uniref:thioredoxin family protein n=1 Tax=Haloparvum alkalitolerans TaxID=1042953 RepID=UPI003CF461C2